MAFNQQKKFNLSKAQQEPRPKKKVNGKHEIRWAKFNPRKTVITIHINKSLIKSQTLVGMNEITDIHTSIGISLYISTKQVVSGLLAQKIMALICAHLRNLKSNSCSGTSLEGSAVKTVRTQAP